MLAPETSLQSDLIYRDDTALAWLAWTIRLHCQPWRVVRVTSSWRSALARAEPGMVASLTSSRHSLSSQVAHVRRAGWLGSVCYADLVILSRP